MMTNKSCPLWNKNTVHRERDEYNPNAKTLLGVDEDGKKQIKLNINWQKVSD